MEQTFSSYLKKYQQFIGAINYAIFMLLILSLSFPWAVKQVLWVVWLVGWLVELRWLKRPHWSRQMIPLLLFVGLVALEALSLLWTSNPAQGSRDMARGISFCALPIIAAWGVNEYYRPERLKTALMIGSLLAIISYGTILLWLQTSKSVWLPEWLPGTPLYFKVNGTLHEFKHTTHLSLPLLMSVFFSRDLIAYYRTKYRPWMVCATIGVADAVIIGALMLLGCRIAVIALGIGLLVMAFQGLKGRMKWLIVAVAAALAACGWAWFHTSNRGKILVESIRHADIADNRVDNESQEPRIYIWNTIWKHRGEYGVYGMGMGAENDFLTSCYEQDHNETFASLRYGPHNQWLATWMTLGIAGLLYLILIFVFAPRFYNEKQRPSALLLYLTFAVVMTTETLLVLMDPLYTFFVLLMILSAGEAERSK